MVQPTVSLHVSELESRLGTPLVVRGSRRVSPTAAGAALIDRARRLLRDADEAVDTVKRHAKGQAGRVRLGTSTGVIVHLLPRVLKALEQAHAGIDVEVAILGSNHCMERLAAGTLDIGLIALPQPPVRDLVVTHWRNDPMMAFVPPRWQAPKAATPQWLAAQALIFNDATTRMYRMTMEWFAAAGHAPRARIELNYTEAIKSLVAAGYGAAILPMESSAVAVAAGTDPLQLIPLRPALTRSLGVAHRVPSSLDGATRIVLATLERFRQR